MSEYFVLDITSVYWNVLLFRHKKFRKAAQDVLNPRAVQAYHAKIESEVALLLVQLLRNPGTIQQTFMR